MGHSAYLCESWQGFIQYVATMAGQGYWYYQVIRPETTLSEEKWQNADDRLLKKFNIMQSKDQRYRNRKHGIANYLYVRHHALALLLKTAGSALTGTESEIFYDIRDKPLEVEISSGIRLKIGQGRKERSITVYLSRVSYRALKTVFFEHLEHRQIRELEYKFGILNNLPAYTGINEQKVRLREAIFRLAKAHGVKLSKDKFWICFKRKTYKVFSEMENDIITHEI